MNDSNASKKNEKATKTNRKVEDKHVLTPTFAAMRQTRHDRSAGQAAGSGFLQRQCSCGKHTIAGGKCETCQQQETMTSQMGRGGEEVTAAPFSSMTTTAGQPVQASLSVNAPGDQYEQEADRVADDVMRMPDPALTASAGGVASVFSPVVSRLRAISRIQASGDSGPFQAPLHVESRIHQMQGGGQALPASEREFFEPRMGYDFSSVRVHTDDNAIQASRDIQAHAFTVGNNIAFNQGAYQPGTDAGRRLLAHELTHVVQQTGHALRKFIQRTINPTYDTTNGQFQVTTNAQNAVPPSTRASLPITIRFQPDPAAPYSNQIGLIQIVRDINSDTGGNVEPVSLPASRAGSLRTTADPAAGVEGGFFTDVLHNDEPANPGAGTDAPAGQPLAPQYPFGNDPAQPNPATPGLSRPFSSGAGGATVGYKRSNNPADIKAAELTDAPGSSGNRNFDFETVAKGEDTMTIYGALKWGFEIRSGVIQNEHASVDNAQSATFDAALELHRDFYVHEPVIFYFDFDSRTLASSEADKIDTFLAYLRRFPTVQVTPTGFADQRGNVAYNQQLSLDRARAVETALRTKGVPPAQITAITTTSGGGETDDFTPDATTNQDDEANRRGNRRVVLTFARTGSAGGAGGGAGGGGGAGTP